MVASGLFSPLIRLHSEGTITSIDGNQISYHYPFTLSLHSITVWPGGLQSPTQVFEFLI